MAALNAAGLQADTIMKEYGADQYEVTVEPELGIRAADASLILREMVYATAARFGDHATFTPIRDPAGVGNGVHIHMSFVDDDGMAMTYDETGPHGMSALTAAFAAGVLTYLDSILALTAPADISYLRLTPHRWSAAYNNLGLRDREASLRICPTTTRHPDSIANQFNLEFRAGDAAASPYLALAQYRVCRCPGHRRRSSCAKRDGRGLVAARSSGARSPRLYTFAADPRAGVATICRQ